MASTQEHRLGPPDPERAPLKANVYEFARQANSQLAPIFPVLGRGAHVPAITVFRGGTGIDLGQFFHRNTVEEIIICFGARNSLAGPGSLFMDGKMHGVAIPIAPDDPDAYLVGIVTQRQLDSGEQNESVVFRCRECNAKVFQHDYDATPGAATEDDRTDWMPMLPTLRGSVEAVALYNRDESLRTCPKCSTVNPCFPVDAWGWTNWVNRHDIAAEARRSMTTAAR